MLNTEDSARNSSITNSPSKLDYRRLQQVVIHDIMHVLNQKFSTELGLTESGKIPMQNWYSFFDYFTRALPEKYGGEFIFSLPVGLFKEGSHCASPFSCANEFELFRFLFSSYRKHQNRHPFIQSSGELYSVDYNKGMEVVPLIVFDRSVGILFVTPSIGKMLKSAISIIEREVRSLYASVRIQRQLLDTRIRESHFEALAFVDELTGLLNRRSFTEKGNKLMLKPRKQFALAIFDIDRFKYINDTYGHATGDEAIRFLARITKEFFEKISHRFHVDVARLGGDEFVVILQNNRQEVVGDIFNKFREMIASTPFVFHQGGIRMESKMSISVGIELSDDRSYSRNPQGFSDMLRSADMALYHAKEQGRNRVAWNSSNIQNIGKHI